MYIDKDSHDFFQPEFVSLGMGYSIAARLLCFIIMLGHIFSL